MPRSSTSALAAAHAALQERLADPVWKAEWARKVSAGRGGRTEVTRTCVICSQTFTIAATLARRGEGKVCGAACGRARRAQVLREHHPAKRPAWAAEKRAASIMQWQGSARYQGIAARLRALDEAAFARLPERERQAVRLYYGLVEQEAGPFTHQVIGARLGVSRSRVPQLIA